jgi:hypothetical protein
MPRKNVLVKRRKQSGYTVHHLKFLEMGFDFGWGQGFSPEAGRDRSGERQKSPEVREAWEIFREQILIDWVRREPRPGGHGGPFTRPWAWWYFDAPERRHRLNGVHPFDNPERQDHIREFDEKHPGSARDACSLYFGLPGMLVIHDDFEAVFESEQEYLIRLNLLVDFECRLLEAER